MVNAVENVGELIGNGDVITPPVDVITAPADASLSLNVPKELLPNGNYVLVGIDIDTTGRRLIDEIVQLAAYTPTNHFEQYIMPYMNLNPAARQRHQVRVISIGFYRMLKSMQTYKIIKSKSEIAALKDFLDWLEDLKAKNANASDGLILVYHEERKFIPYMILESLKKYSLLDRFANTVKSFVNGLNLAKNNVNDAIKHYSLRKLSKYLSKVAEENNNNNSNNDNILSNADNSKEKSQQTPPMPQKPRNGTYPYDREQFDGNASVRAKLAYNVALNLSNKDAAAVATDVAHTNMYNAVKEFASPISCDLQELDTQNANLERQNSFRPVFLNYFKTTLYHRVRAVKFRIVLAEHGFDLQGLNSIWKEKHADGLLEAFRVIQTLKTDDKAELVQLLDSYFDPSKTTIKPVIKVNNNRRRNRRVRGAAAANNKNDNAPSVNATTEYGAGGDKSQNVPTVPDSTTKTPSPSKTNGVNAGNVGGGMPRGQRKRGPRNSYNPNMKTQITTNAQTGAIAAATPQANSVPLAAAPVPIAAST